MVSFRFIGLAEFNGSKDIGIVGIHGYALTDDRVPSSLSITSRSKVRVSRIYDRRIIGKSSRIDLRTLTSVLGCE